MPDPNVPQNPPQFRTAEYASEPGSDRCKFCNQALEGSYFRVNRSMACAACAAQVRQKIPLDNHAAFTRGLLFGVGGAILGLILYSVVGIVTGFTIGYVSLAVGWMVGKAMMMGSGGIGGRRYQLAAVLLTYAAVSIAAVPIYLAQASKARKAAPTERWQSARNPGEYSGNPSPAQETPTARPHAGLSSALLMMVLYGLASPFLELQDPFHGLIGLVILFVGIQFTWKITQGVSIKIMGPFKLSAPSAANLSAG